MDAHELAEELLKLPKGTKVWTHGSYDDLFATNLKVGKDGRKKVAVIYPDPRENMDEGHIKFEK